MDRLKKKTQRRLRIKKGIRKKLAGSPELPRLSVFRSTSEIYAQIIDDESGHTLVSASSLEKDLQADKLPKMQMAAKLGNVIAERAKEANINTVIFDRNGFLYHGRVKALAEAAREQGLKF